MSGLLIFFLIFDTALAYNIVVVRPLMWYDRYNSRSLCYALVISNCLSVTGHHWEHAHEMGTRSQRRRTQYLDRKKVCQNPILNNCAFLHVLTFHWDTNTRTCCCCYEYYYTFLIVLCISNRFLNFTQSLKPLNWQHHLRHCDPELKSSTCLKYRYKCMPVLRSCSLILCWAKGIIVFQ